MPKKPISARAKREWQRLTEWYGARFAEQYGETPPEDWCEVIDRTDSMQLKRGLAIIRAKYTVHPPTLPQFDQAMAPVRSGNNVSGPAMPERLTAHAIREFGRQLTPRQIASPWTYLARTEGDLVEITGVIIPADGTNPTFRLNASDLDVPAFFGQQHEERA